MVVTFPIETPAQRQVLGVAIAFSVLAVVAVCLRLLAHHLARKRWITSDYFIIAGGVSICPVNLLNYANQYRSSPSASSLSASPA